MISWSDSSSYSSVTGFARAPFWGRGTSGQQFLSIRSFLGVPSTGELRGELAPELEHDEHRLSGREGPPGGNTSLRKKNFCVCSALRFCARAMFSSTFAHTSLCECLPIRGRAFVTRTYFGDGKVEVEVEGEDRTREEYDEDRERGIFEVGHLDLH